MGALQVSLSAWADGARRDLPWRRTRDPWAVLVSEFMLQQTQVARVLPVYSEWLRRWPSPAALAAALLSVCSKLETMHLNLLTG